jgi:hypothetical protein
LCNDPDAVVGSSHPTEAVAFVTLVFLLFCIFVLLSLRRSGAPVFHEHDEHSLDYVDVDRQKYQRIHRVRLQRFRILTLFFLGCQLSFEILLPLLDMTSVPSVSFVTPHLSLQSSDL